MSQNNILLIMLDSVRYDTYSAAYTPNMDKVSKPRLVHSFACWTIPSVLGYLYGFPPIGAGRNHFLPNVPRYHWAPKYLKGLGYMTAWFSANPIICKLNEMTDNQFLRHWRYYKEHIQTSTKTLIKEFDKIVGYEDLRLFASFLIMDTHRPYNWGTGSQDMVLNPSINFENQVKTIEYFDTLFPSIMTSFKKDGRKVDVVITSDHGECFGPDGKGHDPSSRVNPIHFTEKLFAIPLVEGEVTP